jgi:hypothetical protein
LYRFLAVKFCLRARKKRMKAFLIRFTRLRTTWFLKAVRYSLVA